jgi:hypothetical protein
VASNPSIIHSELGDQVSGNTALNRDALTWNNRGVIVCNIHAGWWQGGRGD